MADDDCPTCEKCGARITIGLMAALCPLERECALHPGEESEESVAFFRELFREPKEAAGGESKP